METKKVLYLGVVAFGIAALLASYPFPLSGQQKDNAAVSIDNDDIGGVVRSSKGPEAGV